MLRRFWWIGFIVGCGGGHEKIALVPTIAAQQWYRSLADCAQGPFELEVPVHGAKYGEDVELRVAAPRSVRLEAVVSIDGKEAQHAPFGGQPDNARCVASAHERLELARASGGGSSAGATAVGVAPPPAQVAVTPQLELVATPPSASAEVIHVRISNPQARVVVRFWSIDPNDLRGVLFGVADVKWAPNVPEAQYEQYLRDEAERERKRDEAWAREHQVDPYSATLRVAARPGEAGAFDPRAAAEARRRAEAEAARRAAAEAEAERRAAIAAALEAERRRARAAFCKAHPDDRDCWGAGGHAVSADLDRHDAERAAYCAAHAEDARCWSDAERARRAAVWDARVTAALAPPKKPGVTVPDGPPPAALAETIPPKLSDHAEWRPGYWQWTEGKWMWLAGMWRVPDSDIVADHTTRAPQAPPPAQVETPPAPPVTVAVWVGGFWQWSGATWVWIPGSWQLRPEAGATWRAPEWRARGAVHVLVPGAWVKR